MGSKGSQTVTQTGQQTYTPAAPIGQAGTQAINMAQQAAGAPFQMPVAPVAPFNPYQQLGFGETLGAQGMAQPYFGIGSQYLAGSAAPISGQDVANYYNPMAANVFANLQDIFGQQMRETTGQATQTAGGVGADRIGVAQANLAKQQGLAAGQTASQLYQQALQAAEQQKQMMAGAGYGFGQMGPAAQAAQLQGIGALLGVGGQQQQLTQAQLNALYQNQLAQIAYPFQTAQYLAGITGGLAPAMGGTTAGTQTTTQPSPTLAAQLLGIGTAGLGLYGGMGGTFSNPFASATPTGPTNMSFNTAGLGSGGSYYYQSGGGIDSDYGKLADKAYRKELGDMVPAAEAGNPMADIMMQDIGGSLPMQGGGVPNRAIPSALSPQASPVAAGVLGGTAPTQAASVAPPFSGAIPSQRPQWGQISQMMQPPSSPFGGMKGSRMGYQSGGAANQEQPPPFPGASVPKAGGASPIPFISLQPGSGEFHNRLQFSSPHLGGSGSGLGDVAKIASAAAQMLPMLMVARGGGVSPFDVGQPFANGGPSDDDIPLPQPNPLGGLTPEMREKFPALRSAAAERGVTFDIGEGYRPQERQNRLYAQGRTAPGPVVTGTPFSYHTTGNAIDVIPTEGTSEADIGRTVTNLTRTDPRFAGMRSGATFSNLYDPAHVELLGNQEARTPGGAPIAEASIPSGARPAAFANPLVANADMTAGRYMLPAADRPYPDALQRDWGQNLARSPWMALVKAGAQMAQTRGPIGSVIGAGLGAGAGELEGQRKELRSEQDINLKAQALYQRAQEHLDEYQREKPMTAYQAMEAAKPVIAGQTIDALGRTHNIYVQRMPDGSYKQVDVPGVTSGAAPSGAEELSGKTGDEWLDAATKSGVINEGQARKIKQIASGDQDLSKVTSYRERGAIADLVSQYDPSFNTYNAPLRAQTAKNYTGTGVEARNFTSNDMAIKHIASGLGNIEALGNLTYVPALNVPYNVWRRETSPKFQEAQSGLKTDIDAIGSELMRSFRGSGSASEREATEWRNNFPVNGSPVEMRRAFQEAANLLAGRITAAGNRYNDAMGPLHARDPLSWLSPEGKNIINYTTNQLDPQKPIPSNWKDIVSGKATTAPAGHEGPRPSPEERFNQLRQSGLDKAAAYAKMHQEGY